MDITTAKLGRRPPKNAPALRLAPLLTGVVPTAPLTADHFARVPRWVLGENDRYGDCGPVSVANQRLLITTYLTDQPQTATQDDIFDLYRRSGNPNFNPVTDADDNGVDMQTMCEALIAGGISGNRALAFAKVDVKNLNEVRDAIAIFGSLLLGVDLEVAQQKQTALRLWDYESSAVWGGHAIVSGRYSDSATDSLDRTAVITWAEVVDMTDGFISHQLGEAWVVIWPEHLSSRAFIEGVNLDQLRADYEALTGRPFPSPAPAPTPSPVPAPTPVPEAVTPSDTLLAGSVRSWAYARHSGDNRTAALAVQAWLRAKGL